MKYLRPKPTPETLIDIVAIDQDAKIWLQQAKNTAPEWTLIRRYVTPKDPLGQAHEQLSHMGFIVHEIMVLRAGELFWSDKGKPRRMPHQLLVAGVNIGEPPASKDYYLEAREYNDALKAHQHYSTDMKQLYDPTIDVMIRRQKLTKK
jgi:hypothetical protein